MKIRLRWFGLAARGVSLNTLSERMLARQYSRKRAVGFRLDEVRKEFIAGTFLERLEWEDEVEDPAQGLLHFPRIELRQTRFRVNVGLRQVELVNPPRSLQGFVEQLSECVGDQVRFAEIAMPPDLWLASFDGRSKKFVVTSLTTSSISLSAGASATVNITGREDVRAYVARFSAGKTVAADRLIVTMPAPLSARVELLSGARACIWDGGERIIQALRDALQTALLSGVK